MPIPSPGDLPNPGINPRSPALHVDSCKEDAINRKGSQINSLKTLQVSSYTQLVQLLSHVRLFMTPWIAAHQASLSITNSRSLPKLMSIESVIPSNHLILCHPLFLQPSIFASIRVFSNESVLHIRWTNYWSSSFNISASNEYSGMISFRRGRLDLFAVQGTLKSLLQHQVQKHQFFSAQLSL